AAPWGFNVGTRLCSATGMALGLALADLTGTGNQDILVTNPFDGTLTVIANAGTGVFTPLAPVALNRTAGTTYSPTGITVGDFRHTGRFDVAISHSGSKSGVTLLAGNGDRTFAAPVELTVTITNAAASPPADLDTAGQPDLP